MTKKYVFSNKQFAKLIVAGAEAAGVITAAAGDINVDTTDGVELEVTENGYIVEFTTTGPGAVQAAPEEGPDATTVQAALAKAMEHPPWMNTINSWNAKQRRAVLKWAKAPETTRPDFIKERKPRAKNKADGAAKEAVSASPAEKKTLTSPVVNGAPAIREFREESASGESAGA